MRYSISTTSRAAISVAAVAVLLLAGLGHASPTNPVTLSVPPSDQGAAFVPGVRGLTPLTSSYVEEEYFVSGEATLYNYAHNPPLGPTDITPIGADVPYTTRIIVRRPVSMGRFNGTVVIEWWNSTAGFDTAPVWDPSANYFLREGYAYVGITNSTTSLAFLTGGCSVLGVLPPTCGTRYSVLSLPENGLAYEMASQIAHLLKSDSPENPLPADFDVERIYHAGQSQQGGSMVTYASAFHFPDNDGYFVQQAASARPINFGPACGASGSPLYPDCTPRLQGDDRLVRTDLPVPVYHANSETDLEILFGTAGRQADTPTFRYYEVAGASHLTVHDDVEFIPADIFFPGSPPLYLQDFCNAEINSTADGPVFFGYVTNALWHAMEQQVKNGSAAPAGVMMDTDSNTGVVLRDADGNGLGGVRLPSMDVPVATYTPGNSASPALPPFLQPIGNLACFLASSVTPFSDTRLDELYPNHGNYVSQVALAANSLSSQGLLLPKDRQKIMRAASHSTIGCGLGFEAALLVPALMWLRKRRKA
jgi:hypothetical protein